MGLLEQAHTDLPHLEPARSKILRVSILTPELIHVISCLFFIKRWTETNPRPQDLTRTHLGSYSQSVQRTSRRSCWGWAAFSCNGKEGQWCSMSSPQLPTPHICCGYQVWKILRYSAHPPLTPRSETTQVAISLATTESFGALSQHAVCTGLGEKLLQISSQISVQTIFIRKTPCKVCLSQNVGQHVSNTCRP